MGNDGKIWTVVWSKTESVCGWTKSEDEAHEAAKEMNGMLDKLEDGVIAAGNNDYFYVSGLSPIEGHLNVCREFGILP